ncbi:RING-H2 finger protein ATL11 [Linum grandiflorum]
MSTNSTTVGNSGTEKEKSVRADIVIIIVISFPSLVIFSVFLYKVAARFIRDKYRRKWVERHLLPRLQQMSYGEAIQLIAGRFEAVKCSVCLEEFELEDETVTVLPGCNHIYRPKCIKDWLLKSTLLPTFPCCPVCMEFWYVDQQIVATGHIRWSVPSVPAGGLTDDLRDNSLLNIS